MIVIPTGSVQKLNSYILQPSCRGGMQRVIRSDTAHIHALCKKLDIRYRIFCVYFEFTHQESHLRNEPVSHCVYFEYPQPHHVRLEGFTKQCLRIPLCTVYGAGYALRFCSWYTSWILNLLQSKTYTYNNQYSTFKLCSYRGKTPLLALQLAARVAQQSIATRQRESCASCWPALQTASPQNSYSKKKGHP